MQTLTACALLSLCSGVVAQCPWAVVSPGTLPPDRSQGAMVYDSARGRIVLFGGRKDQAYFNDTWEWDGSVWSNLTPATGPSARFGCAMAYDSARGKTVLFGGSGGSGISPAQTWEWNGTVWMQIATASAPAARYGHSMAFDASIGKVVLYGGSGGPVRNDTWTWDGVAWVQLATTSGPAGSMFHAMAYDATRGRTVLFGGSSSPFFLAMTNSETWELNAATGEWTFKNFSASGPAARMGQSMAYDSSRQRVVMCGGVELVSSANGGNAVFRPLGDTWEWDGTWIRRSDVPFWPRQNHAAAFDTQRARMVVFGGDSTNSPGLMCTFDGGTTGPIQFLTQPQSRVASAGEAVFFSAWAPGASSIQWYKGAAAIAGETSSKLHLPSVFAADSSVYYAVIGTPCGQVSSDQALLQVIVTNCYANCDQSTAAPVLTANDFICFLNSYMVGASYANCDGTTSIPNLTANDFQCFLNQFASGCH